MLELLYLALHAVIVCRKPMDRRAKSLSRLEHLVVLAARISADEHGLERFLLHSLVLVVELHLGRRHLGENDEARLRACESLFCVREPEPTGATKAKSTAFCR